MNFAFVTRGFKQKINRWVVAVNALSVMCGTARGAVERNKRPAAVRYKKIPVFVHASRSEIRQHINRINNRVAVFLYSVV